MALKQPKPITMLVLLRKRKALVLLLFVTVIVVFIFFFRDAVRSKSATTVIYIQPLGKVNADYTAFLKQSVATFYGYDCVVKPNIPLTRDLLAASQTRYEASKILAKFNSDKNLLLITTVDIAYRKSAEMPEYGIFGLGFRPGNTCVVSTFRLQHKVTQAQFLERLKKVALHEIGHNLGLPHCTNHPECMMHDANGTIKQVDKEKVWFCEQCRKQLEE